MRGDVAKGEVSYDQRAFVLKSVRDHYPENILKEGIVRSLQSCAVGIIRYLGCLLTF